MGVVCCVGNRFRRLYTISYLKQETKKRGGGGGGGGDEDGGEGRGEEEAE